MIEIHMPVAPNAFGGRMRSPRRTLRKRASPSRPRGFGAAVTPSEFFHAPGSIDELLFAGEKWMASGTNTDLNIPTRRAGVIHRAARAHDIGLVILWMNACFHLQKGTD